MKRYNIILTFVFCVLTLLKSINSQCSIETATPKFRKAIFDFSVDLIKKLSFEEENNFVVSPLSIWTVLSATSEGTAGNTYKEIKQFLHLNKHICFRTKYLQLVKYLSEKSDDVIFERSSVIVVDNTLEPNELFVKRLTQLQVASIVSFNLEDLDNSIHDINEHITNATHGKVDNVVRPKDIMEDGLIALIDAVYFTGLWNTSFDPSRTSVNDFFDSEGSEIGKVNMMRVSGSFYSTVMNNIGATILELPYGSDDRFAMLIFLPLKGVQLNDVIEDLDVITLNAVYHNFTKSGKSSLDVYLPRFTIRSDYDDMQISLMEMGIQRLFQHGAEVYGIVPDLYVGATYVTKMKHKAIVEVAEKGISAPGQSFGLSNLFTSFFTKANTVVKMDKPFLYLILEKYTQTVVLAGAFSKPNVE